MGLLSVFDDLGQFLVDKALVRSPLLGQLSLVQLLESLDDLLMAVVSLLLLMMLLELPQSVSRLLLVNHMLLVVNWLVSDDPLLVSWFHLPNMLSLVEVLFQVVLPEL